MTDNASSSTESIEDNQKFRSQAPTSRGVTLAMLIRDGIIKPGHGVLSIDYLGRKFIADLLSDGRIFWPEGKEEFGSPSAWAVYCKRLSNPDSRSGCGWASVKYLGRKLDSWKTTWYRYTHRSSPEIPIVDVPSVDAESGDTDVRRLPPLDFSQQNDAVDCGQVARTVQYNQLDAEQSYKVEVDSSLLFFMALLASKGCDLNGLLLGTVEKGLISCRTAILMTHDEREADVRSRLINRSSSKDTFVGWFSFHIDYAYCGPTVAEVNKHCEIQAFIQPAVGMVVNCHKSVANAFMVFHTVKPQNHCPVGIELEVQVVDMPDNFQLNADEFLGRLSLSHLNLGDAAIFSSTPLVKKLPNFDILWQRLATLS